MARAIEIQFSRRIVMTIDPRQHILSGAALALAVIATSFILIDRWRPPVDQRRLIGTIVHGSPKTARASLVLVTSPDCRYCQASVPFYQKLGALAAESGDALSLRAVVPVPPQEAREYLESRDLLWSLSTLDLGRLGISTTPTLLLLDSDSRVQRVWVGFLNQQGRAEVIRSLRSVCPTCVKEWADSLLPTTGG
jgi:hypothetical protein